MPPLPRRLLASWTGVAMAGGLTVLAPMASSASAQSLATSAGPSAVALPASPQARALTWDRCSDSSLPSTTRCATMSVPRDWNAPSAGPTYRIALARIPAGQPSQRIGVLTFNPGGPGSAGVSNIGWVYSMLPQSVRDRFDIVAWDPRGVGSSQPTISSCTVADVQPPKTGPVNWKKWTRTYVTAQETAAQQCWRVNGEDAKYIGTWQLVHDVDYLRTLLGEKKLTFWGMSYGSTVGRAYAQYFPRQVRAMVLDGAISPVSTVTSWSREHIWDEPLAINTMLGALGPHYVKVYRRVFAALDERPLPYYGGTITRWEAGRQIISWASFQTTWSSAAALLDALGKEAKPGASMTAALAVPHTSQPPVSADRLEGRDGFGSAGVGDGKSAFEAQYTYVNCADFPDRPTIAELAVIAEAAAGSGGVHVGQSALREGAQCAGLPAFGTPLAPIDDPLALSTPPLVTNSIADNRTPWSGAQQVTNAFVGSRLVGYRGTHHIIYGRTTSCVAKPVTTYLLTLVLPRWNITCPLVY